MGNVFDEMGLFWAEIADQNHTESQIRFLKLQLKLGGYVLDLACGTGRHTIPLTQPGFEVVGFDVSFKLLKIAKQRGGKALVRGDMRFLPFKSDVFNAVISVDTSFGYLPREADDIHCLVEVQRVLDQSGLFVIDIFNRDHLAKKYQGKDVAPVTLEYPSFVLVLKRSLSPDAEWLCDNWEVKDIASGETEVFVHRVRLYSQSKLEGLLSSTGFGVKSVFGGYEMQPHSPEAPRLILVAYATRFQAYNSRILQKEL